MNNTVHAGWTDNEFQNMKSMPLFFSALSVPSHKCRGFNCLAGWASPQVHPEVVSIRVRGRPTP